MLSPQPLSRFVRGAIASGLILGLACFWWLCSQSPEIDFLGKSGPAEWILYPKPPDGATHRAAEWSAVFRRSFAMDHTPAKVMLSVRAFKRFELRINGLSVDASVASSPDWKTPSELDVTGTLHAGTNEISVTVTNNRGPPALWLSLQADAFTLNTDTNWEASLAGAVWRNAREASQPMEIARGNPFFGGESPLRSALNQWRALLLFAVISAAIILGGTWWARHSVRAALCVHTTGGQGTARSTPETTPGCAPSKPRCGLVIALLAVVVVLWTALFINNLGLLPRRTGFDVDAHLDYINFIRAHHALPLATDGWEMCQPPLYYLVSAALLSPLSAATFSDTAVQVLRVFGLLMGVAHFALILLSLRLLFLGQMKKQLIGLLLAGFLPEHLYISHYVTNEALSALFVSGALYFCLRILTSEQATWRLFLAVGSCLGAALLTKITAVLAVPFIFGALGMRLLRRTSPASSENKQPSVTLALGAVVVAMFTVCGWHYLRVWIHFGSPIVHDWDPVSGFAWWTDEGFQTSSYLTRFGGCLVHPFYSVFHGLGDGLYSTFWGDGLCGSVVRLDRRPPWNYELMAAGFLLSLLPAAAILTGAIVSIVRFLRRPEPVFFLLLGVPVITFAALLYMNLKLPFYCNVKAFYGLTALLPICALGAVGYDAISQALGRLRPVFWVLLGVWAINAYASFWIRAGAPSTQTTRAWYLAADGRNEDAAREFSKVLQQNPHDAQARKGLGLCLWQEEHLAEAKTQTEQALNDDPADADGHVQLASILARQNQLTAAVQEAKHAGELAPDMAAAHIKLCVWLSRLERWPEAVIAGREGLRIEPMNAELHLNTGVALAALGKHADALVELRSACEFKPDWPEARDRLGLSLASFNQWPEAAREFDAACGLKPDEPSFHYHLALSLQAVGQDQKAILAYRQALRLNPDLLPALNNLASILATHANPQLRDGSEAVRLAERASQLNGGQTASYQATLAAAYAEAGQFAKAIEVANQALTGALEANQLNLANALRQQLELYRGSRAYHQEGFSPRGGAQSSSPAR